MMKFVSLLLCALLLFVPVCNAEEAAATTTDVAASVDYEAAIAEKDAEIAQLNEKLAELQKEYDALQSSYETLLAQSAYTTLSTGSKGEDVIRLQDKLIALGYLEGNADGSFGKGTKAAVERFQNMVGIEATGIADGKTQMALFAADAPKATASQSASAFDAGDYEDYDYAIHSETPDAYNGRKVTFIGTIRQALDMQGTAVFRIATSGESDNIVYATYIYSDGEGLLYKGDAVTVYAVTNGTKTYTTTTGTQKTLPAVEIKKIDKRG